jgi:S1-C subfamily serine protease
LIFLAIVVSLLSPATARAQDNAVTGQQAALAIQQALVESIARAEKSVVAIARVTREPNQRGMLPVDPTDPDFIPNEFGTGVVIDRRGLILTQYHLLKQGDDHWVTTADRRVLPAKIKGADPRSGLAVLSVEASDLAPISLGDATKLRKGHLVIALGNPYAIARDGQVSASWGIVSNLGRKAGPVASDDPRDVRPTLHHFGTLIQTDAKLNLGTSGGALINLRGEMVGLTTSMAATAGFEMAAGYAVPIDPAFLRVIQILKEGREVEYGLLGIQPRNLPAGPGEGGMLVAHVLPGTPADDAGLDVGDVVTHVNGRAVNDADGLMLEIGQQPVDAWVKLNYLRGGRPRLASVQLTKYPVRGEQIVTNRPAAWRGVEVDYATTAENYDTQARLGLIDYDGCVVIRGVERDSPAWREGLRPNMFIRQAAGVRIRRPSEFYAAVGRNNGPIRIELTLPADQRPLRTVQPR